MSISFIILLVYNFIISISLAAVFTLNSYQIEYDRAVHVEVYFDLKYVWFNIYLLDEDMSDTRKTIKYTCNVHPHIII